MRKAILILLLSLLWLNLGSSLALADGMILPQALSPDYLVVRYHRVTVNIEDSHAVTRVEQEFYNPHPFSVEGRYLFPVPPEAILSRFLAVVDGQPQSVQRQDPATTNAALYPIITQRRDPSLLQYADWESLAFDLSLPPGGSRQMSLEYEEVLVPSGGIRWTSNGLGRARRRSGGKPRTFSPATTLSCSSPRPREALAAACSLVGATITTTSCSSFRRKPNQVRTALCPKTSCL